MASREVLFAYNVGNAFLPYDRYAWEKAASGSIVRVRRSIPLGHVVLGNSDEETKLSGTVHAKRYFTEKIVADSPEEVHDFASYPELTLDLRINSDSPKPVLSRRIILEDGDPAHCCRSHGFGAVAATTENGGRLLSRIRHDGLFTGMIRDSLQPDTWLTLEDPPPLQINHTINRLVAGGLYIASAQLLTPPTFVPGQ